MFSNSGFETGSSPWFAFNGGTMQQSGDDANSGSFSGVLTARTNTGSGAGYDLLNNAVTPAVPGQTYRFTAFVGIGNSASDVVHVTLRQRCLAGADNFDRMASDVPVADTGWAQVTGTAVVRDECTLDRLQVYVEGPPSAVDIFIDDASFVLEE